MRTYHPPPMRSMLDALADVTVVLDGEFQLLRHDGNLSRVLRDDAPGVENAVVVALRPHLAGAPGDKAGLEFECQPEHLPPLLVSAMRVSAQQSTVWVVRLANKAERLKLLQEVRLATKFRALVRQHQITAHDLKQPISVIKLYTQVLSSRIPPGDRHPENGRMSPAAILQVIEEAATTVDDAVQAMLRDMTHTDEGQTQFDAGPEIERVLAGIRAQAAHLGIAVTSRALPHPVMLEGVPDRFRQVVMNLCVNALEAMNDLEGGRLGVEAVIAGGELVLEVVDNGPGMASDVAARAFDMHYTTKASGHGVGLNGVLQIVTDMGGSVSFATDPGEGCRFKVRIPARG